MKNAIRWERGVMALAGVYLMAVPLFTQGVSDNADVWVAELAGAALILVALGAMYFELEQSAEVSTFLIGVATFASPWLFDYSDAEGVAWNTWAVGLVAAVVAAASFIAESRGEMRAPRPGHGALSH